MTEETGCQKLSNCRGPHLFEGEWVSEVGLLQGSTFEGEWVSEVGLLQGPTLFGGEWVSEVGLL